jgi:mannose-6-phosphate isomerase-like protein (cupin superfamily)
MKINSLEEIKPEPSKDNPKIKTKVLLKKGKLPHVEIIGQMTLKSGNVASEHVHEKTNEFFLIEKGAGIIKIDGKVEKIKEGNFILIEAGEAHEVLNTGSEDLIITYIEILKKK